MIVILFIFLISVQFGLFMVSPGWHINWWSLFQFVGNCRLWVIVGRRWSDFILFRQPRPRTQWYTSICSRNLIHLGHRMLIMKFWCNNISLQLCTVLVENLPDDHSVENLQRIFGEAGKYVSPTTPHQKKKKSKQKIVSWILI